MTKTMRETTSVVALGSVTEERDAVKAAFQEVQSSFENFCLLAGIEAFQDLLEEEAADLCGERHQRHEDRRGRRWGKARSPVAFHGGRVDIERPRVRTPDGQQELELPSLAAGQREDWLGRWAMNQMLINVSTRRFRRSVRLPDGDVASARGDGTSKSAVSRKFVALSSAKLKDWLATRSVVSGPAGDPDRRPARPGGPDPGRGGRHRRHGREAPAGAGRGGHRECRHGSGAARQPGRARPRPGGGAAVHHRRRQGPVQGDPPHVWQEHADPALPGSQGPEHCRASAQGGARHGAQGSPAGLGDGGCRQGRAADPEPGAAAGQGVARHRRHHPGRD